METNENENMTVPKPMGCSKRSHKSQVYSNTGLPQEEVSNTQPKLTQKGAWQKTTNVT